MSIPDFNLVLENIDFRKFADALSVIIFAYSDDKYIYVNPAFENATKFKLEELLQMNFWDICHPDYKELVKARGQARLRQESVPSNYEIRALRKDGSDLWVDVFFSVTQVGGKTISIVGAYDITERKSLQEALALSEAQYRTVVEDQTEFILRCRPDGRITFLNKALYNHFNINNTAIKNDQLESHLFGHKFGMLTQIKDHLLSGVPSYILEQEVIKADGSYWYEWIFRGITDESGEIVEYQAVGRDISDRKKAQRILQEARDKLEISVQERTIELRRKNQELTLLNHNLNTVITNMSDGVIFLHSSGDFELLNPNFRKLLPGDYRNFKNNFPTWINADNNKYRKHLFELRQAFQNEEIIISDANTSLRFLASGTPIVGENGQVNTAILLMRPLKEVHHLVSRFSGYTARFNFENIITNDPFMQEIISVAKLAANSNSNVLIEGESGTGKELFAQAIHNASHRANGAFVAVNCGAIPRELIASELFGYNEGAFTGAKKEGKPGKFELADGGTLFLDEIGDMPLELQVTLLRAIQEKSICRIGSNQIIPTNVRIICATNKNLFLEMQKGNFRKDLFYRLNVIDLHILPLRERPQDIILLFQYFLDQEKTGVDQTLSLELKNSLLAYNWPGNVRELQNVVEKMVNLNDFSAHSFNLSHQQPMPTQSNSTILSIQQARAQYKDEQIEVERNRIISLLEKHDGNVSQVAREMGVSRSTLYRKMKNLRFTNN